MGWPSWSVLVIVNLRALVSPTCTMNKLIFTEKPVSVFQVKIAYINFLNHCYVDTEVEMKEIYTSNHMWKLFENFLVDICRVRLSGTEEAGEGVGGVDLPVRQRMTGMPLELASWWPTEVPGSFTASPFS